MDETSRLISDLRRKLQELDLKVWLYRQDMASEYTKYAEGLLRDAPEAVSNSVKIAIAERMDSFPSLTPVKLGSPVPPACADGNDNTVSQAVDAANPRLACVQRPAMAHSISDPPPRSPHARDNEFQGVFTPNYLPLLFGRNNNNNNNNNNNINHEAASAEGPPAYEAATGRAANIDIMRPTRAGTSIPASSSYTPDSPLPKLQLPRRRNTDDVPPGSDRRDSSKPRSALRRTSSASKNQSPRQVRFEFEGEQYTTTSSPRPPAPISDTIDSELPTQPKTNTDMDDEPEYETAEDAKYAGSQKKVSSTQALRALSRGPIEDDGTQWTAVCAPPDGSASVGSTTGVEEGEDFFGMQSSRQAAETANANYSTPSKLADHFTANLDEQGRSAGSNISLNGSSMDDDTAEEEEEDDVLAEMTPLQPMRSQRFISSPVDKQFGSTPTLISGDGNDKSTTMANKETTSGPQPMSSSSANPKTLVQTQTLSNGSETPKDDEEELFGFEDEKYGDARNVEHYIQQESSEEDDTLSDKSNEGDEDKSVARLSEYSRSPARDIIHPRAQTLESADAVPKTQTSSMQAGGGSVRGNHPFSIPVVNEVVHAEAARMGPLSSFVGSLSGKSGPDASDVNSYGGMGSFRVGSSTGAPLSLTERMMLEDYMEEQKRAGLREDTKDQ
ncbi:MAG: hypothetical protein M1818_007888 [Claussenomyces sp. TS43310]|nr:MAG: hypothetical protein M1818_007888 [Claussenomyces sp. TS43310]